MKQMIITLLYSMIRQYLGPQTFVRIVGAVSSLLNANLPGEQKRTIVHDALQVEIQAVGSIAINAAIEIVLLKLTSRA